MASMAGGVNESTYSSTRSVPKRNSTEPWRPSMPDVPDVITLEVRREKAGSDPPIPIFRAVLSYRGGWPETFGSKELFQAYLKGVEVALRSLGYNASLDWHI